VRLNLRDPLAPTNHNYRLLVTLGSVHEKMLYLLEDDLTLTLEMSFSNVNISRLFITMQFMPIGCISGNTALSNFFLFSTTADTLYFMGITQ
jgi:hypothetical protein